MKMAESSPRRVENTVGKGEIARYGYFSFSHNVFKRFVLQTRKNQGLFGKGLKYIDNLKMYVFANWSKFPFYLSLVYFFISYPSLPYYQYFESLILKF